MALRQSTLANEFIFDWLANRLWLFLLSRPRSHIHRNLQTGLLKPVLKCLKFAYELVKFLIAKFSENKVADLLLLGSQARDVLVSFIRQRHLHDSGISFGCLSAHKAFLFEHFRLSRDERRIHIEHLRNDIHWNAFATVQIGQSCQDHPLRAANTERFRPERTNLLQMHAYAGDRPSQFLSNVEIRYFELSQVSRFGSTRQLGSLLQVVFHCLSGAEHESNSL